MCEYFEYQNNGWGLRTTITQSEHYPVLGCCRQTGVGTLNRRLNDDLPDMYPREDKVLHRCETCEYGQFYVLVGAKYIIWLCGVLVMRSQYTFIGV